MRQATAIAGWLAASAYALQSILSYWLAQGPPSDAGLGEQGPFYRSLTGLSPPAFVQDDATFVLLLAAPLAVVTLVCAALLARLYASPGIDEASIDRMARWAIVFAVINVFALPVVAQDFWSSLAWGKMILAGLNPYHTVMPAAIGEAWFPDHYRPTMVYGPFWALPMAAIGALTDNRWVAFFLAKLLLAAFWLLAFAIVRRATARCTPAERGIAIVMAGWMPVAIQQGVGEGHVDMAMTGMVMLWLATRNSFALAAAVVIKYTAAPLALFVLRDRRRPAEIAGAALMAIAAIGLFFRGPAFLGGNSDLLAWHFMTPRDALAFLGRGAVIGVLPFLAVAVVAVVRYLRDAAEPNRTHAAIAVMSLLLFAVYPLVWPWYLAVVLIPAALVPRWGLSIWIAGFSLMAPFSIMSQTIGLGREWMAPWPAVLVYAVSLAWLAVMLIRSRRSAPAGPA